MVKEKKKPLCKTVELSEHCKGWLADDGKIHVVTNEDAECKYSDESCRFDWEYGESMGLRKEHSVSVVHGSRYYVKCEDEAGNRPLDCSITIQAL